MLGDHFDYVRHVVFFAPLYLQYEILNGLDEN
jgi:hypothetical protein